MIHTTTAYYDGEGVYAWACACGAAETDIIDLFQAVDDGHVHEDEEATMTKESVK